MTSKKIVVKVGTSTLTQGGKHLSQKFMLELTRQLSVLHEQGHQVILVSSGAIAAGRDQLKHLVVDKTLPSKQMYAAVGQVQLMQAWIKLFSLFDINIGQVLLTRDDVSEGKRSINSKNALSCMLQHRIIPIINENDTVATEEICVGDNDNLAALVSGLVDADLLILLTDQKGLYTADPRHNPQAEFIPVVKTIDDTIYALAGGSSTTLGTGGMVTKIEAADKAVRGGTQTVIASSSHPDVLIEIMKGVSVGTTFLTEELIPEGVLS